MNTSSYATIADIPRQRWLRIIPPILITCIISYMDRVNIAFAMPGGMDQDLGITATMAGLAGGIFVLGYLFLQVPGGKIAVHGSGKKFIGWSLVAWAVISVFTGLVTNHYQLLALRFLLGVAEGGMLPVVLTMISNWFPDAERGRANAIVIMFVPIAGIITAPLSGWIITALDWRWLFIINIPLCVLAGWMLVRRFHEKVHRVTHRIDYLGSVTLTVGAALLILGLLEGGQAWAWTSTPEPTSPTSRKAGTCTCATPTSPHCGPSSTVTGPPPRNSPRRGAPARSTPPSDTAIPAPNCGPLHHLGSLGARPIRRPGTVRSTARHGAPDVDPASPTWPPAAVHTVSQTEPSGGDDAPTIRPAPRAHQLVPVAR